MLATPELYDVIISEPSNPWIAGIASLFPREFYAVAKGKLKPGGIFAQWIHNYSMSPDDFRMVLRTFAESFPHVTVWNMQESDFLLVGSIKPAQFDYPRARQLFASNETLRADFRGLGLSDPYALLGFYRLSKLELDQYVSGAELNTDDNVRLEFSAPRSLGKSTSELNRGIMAPHWVVPTWDSRKTDISRAQHHFFIAQSYRANGAYQRALSEIERAIASETKNPDYYLLQSRILALMDRPEAAFTAMMRALATGRIENIGEILELCEHFYTRDAATVYRRLIDNGSKEIRAYIGLADIALHQKDLKQAGHWVDRASQIKPSDPRLLFSLGKLELARGEAARAITFFEKTRLVGEDSAALFAAMAEAYDQENKWDDAARAYELALKRHRGNIPWRLAWAKALQRAGRHRDAAQRYRELLAMDPNSTDAWHGLKALQRRF